MTLRPNPRAGRSLPDYKLRLEAASLLAKWTDGKAKDSGYDGLCRLLGRPVDDFAKFNDEDARNLELLLGPNGYTIYRMLLVQRGIQL